MVFNGEIYNLRRDPPPLGQNRACLTGRGTRRKASGELALQRLPDPLHVDRGHHGGVIWGARGVEYR